MDNTRRSTAGVRQFEQTAIAKLVAEGVPRHIAHAFVHHGIPKSGRVQELKDQVCKMTFEKFFVERTEEDFKNPARLGGYFPKVVESKMQKFHAEFQMNDIDAAKFVKAFPEFEVVARGRTYNQHAFYANKRYAETELLVAMVFRDALGSDRNPRSLIDFGGNDSWHAKRGRDYVHCDNPVLSARDIMRYKVREIFSNSDRSLVCDKKFSECGVQADYAMAVHSTYDVSPKEIARAMMKKKVKKFFGVINYIPGVEIKPEGTYEADGIVMTIVRPTRGPAYAKCGFKHDPSLEYNHRLSVLRKYLYVNRRYDFESVDGGISSYTYTVHSVRGNSLIFCIREGASRFGFTNAIWTPPSSRLYYVSLTFLGIHRMEVDSEFFDRLVLHASGARNMEQHNIVEAFRYAKSLRQRVSINGVVLSSGYTQTPEQLVNSVIAAYATAMAHRAESGEFFKQASSQIQNLRGKGFFLDVFQVTAAFIAKIAGALPAMAAKASGLIALNDKITQMVAKGGSVNVEVFKPHVAQGIVYDSALLEKQVSTKKIVGVLEGSAGAGLPSYPFQDNVLPTYVECDGHPTCFYSKGLVSYDTRELPRSIDAPRLYKFDDPKYSKDMNFSEVRDGLYKEAIGRIGGFSAYDTQAVVMNNGDRVYRRGLTQADGTRETMRDDVPLVNDTMQYVVFRGVGDKAVTLKPPVMYTKGVCLSFVLFYYKRSTYSSHKSKADAEGLLAHTANDVPESAVPFEEKLYDKEDWQSFDDNSTAVRTFGSSSAGEQFVAEALDRGEYYMSGAIPNSVPATPDSLPRPDPFDALVTDYSTRFAEDSSEARSSVGSPSTPRAGSLSERDGLDRDTVQSDEINIGYNSVAELVTVCTKSESVAIASSATIIDMAHGAARGDTTLSRFQSTAQGHPGDVRLVKVTDGVFMDMVDNVELDHMAVSDGEKVYDKITDPPPDGIYVTSEVMRVYTGAAIKRAVASVMEDKYKCNVVCVNGVAGSGKSYHIEHNAKAGDVVLCETRESLADVARGLHRKPGWRGHAYTVDAFLMHVPVKQADTLWVDEAFRLHAGKIYAVMKLLKPVKVVCFGDDKQIQALPFVPNYDFVYHEFPFDSMTIKTETYRCPADVCFALSRQDYYKAGMKTHNPILRSVQRVEQFRPGMFEHRPKGVPLLVYTRTCKDDLVKQGVKDVLTIGEAQGKTYDEVVLFRESSLNKALYVSKFQTLVALTRHRRKFTYVTVDSFQNDSSCVAELMRYMFGKGGELLYSSHLMPGVKGAEDAAALDYRSRRPPTLRLPSVGSVSAVSELDPENWADFMEDLDNSDL